MGRASFFEQNLYDSYTCLTAGELASLVKTEHLAIVGRLALKVCEEQVLAAVALGDANDAKAYSDAHEIIRRYVHHPKDESVMGDLWTSSQS